MSSFWTLSSWDLRRSSTTVAAVPSGHPAGVVMGSEVYAKAGEQLSEVGEMADCSEELVNVVEAADEACVGLQFLLTNQFTQAMNCMKPKADRSIYHALGQSTIMFMRAVLTLDMADIKAAQDTIRQSVEVCQRFRRRTSTVARMLLRPDYNTYTIEEMHAELCYAECLLENAILTFVEDQSLVTFIKGGLKIRSCYQSYKECMQMLATRVWPEGAEKRHFQSGVHMGVGAFNLLISQLPTRILKLLEFIGFSGNKALGLRELQAGCKMPNTVRGPLCSIILVAYNTFVMYILGLGDGDLELSEVLVDGLLKKYPNGVLSLFFHARLYQVRGEIDKAIARFNEAIAAQDEWRPFQHICFWELLWCYSFIGDWDKASETADVLLAECRWSKATYLYIQAGCMYAKMQEGHPELLDHVAKLMEGIPPLKQRIAGKSIPIEKFVVRKSQKFFENGKRLTLPVIEVMYMWNSFPMIGNNMKLMDQIIGRINDELPEIIKQKETNNLYVDDYCLAMLLKGVCLRYLGKPLDAEMSLLEVLQHEGQINDDTYLLPFACAELGFLAYSQQQYLRAREFLEQARSNYRDYLLESLVHFRIHSALKSIKSNEEAECYLTGTAEPLTPSPMGSPFASPVTTPTRPLNGIFPYLSSSPGVTKKIINGDDTNNKHVIAVTD